MDAAAARVAATHRGDSQLAMMEEDVLDDATRNIARGGKHLPSKDEARTITKAERASKNSTKLPVMGCRRAG
jgi:hypothetical protein